PLSDQRVLLHLADSLKRSHFRFRNIKTYRIAWVQAASTGGICSCLRRVASCATPTGSAGHASATASLKLTFHLDHSVGANQFSEELPIADIPGIMMRLAARHLNV